MEIGLTTFGDVWRDPATGKALDPAKRLQNLIEEIKLADEVGLDVFGVGEHHRYEYAVSAPAVVLAAAAAVTKRIRLGSAVTVLSSDDPVRVFQDFATIDGISNGRAEIWAGRGSFTESFPLFGYDLKDYDRLYADKLDLLLRLRDNERVMWSGLGRAPINDLPVYPRPVQNPLPVWVAVGGNPNSVVRAASLNLPLVLAIIGGAPARFAPLIELYREFGTREQFEDSQLRVAIGSLGFIAEDSQDAAESFYPSYSHAFSQIGRERGWSGMGRAQFDAMVEPTGALLVGSPDQIVEKMIYEYELFQYDRFLLQMSMGFMPHEKVMRGIELFGTKVAPVVRAETAKRKPSSESETVAVSVS